MGGLESNLRGKITEPVDGLDVGVREREVPREHMAAELDGWWHIH